VYSKAKIFNLALGMLLLDRRIIDTETDPSNEAKVLRTHWDSAFSSTLEDLDLDSTSTHGLLELVETDPSVYYLYAYKYPDDCAFFRRVQSSTDVDNRSSHISKRIGVYDGEKVIFTNQDLAVGEWISTDVPLDSISAATALCIACKLAMLAAPLATGKGARALIERLEANYVRLKADAQEKDARENFNYVDIHVESEFVDERTS
jgi:hypothetical protein